jgi:hypothetical protein
MNKQHRTFEPLFKNMSRYEQTENAKHKYTGNWAPAIQGKTISTSAWTLESGNATLSNESSGTGTTSVLVNGIPGENTIVNKVTLSTGEIEEHILKIKIQDNDDPILYDDYWNGVIH